MRNSLLLAAALSAPAFIAPAAAHAADNGFYVGASLGQAHVKIDNLDLGLARLRTVVRHQNLFVP